VTKPADGSDALVIPVVVNKGNVSLLSRGGEQQVGRWYSTMVSATRQGQL